MGEEALIIATLEMGEGSYFKPHFQPFFGFRVIITFQ